MAVYTTIDDSSLFFNTILYTGDGTTKTISGVGFQPDMVWGKGRNSVSDQSLIDAVRGATKSIFPDRGAVEDTNATSYLTGFTADGYTVNSASNFNVSAREQVNWNWKAGTTSGLSGGTITPSGYSFNTTSGFSIITYTGTGSAGTIPHGLGVVPQVVICKKLDGVDGWFSYHEPLGNTGRLMLDNTNAAAYDAGYWDATSPTSSVFSVRGNGGNNATGDAYVAYCFADVAGYSKFGSYIGNSATDGTFVYTGFKPALIILKETGTGTQDWYMNTGKINGYNVQDDYLAPNTDAAEVTGGGNTLDMLSNGFKLRSNTQGVNTGYTYIYLAFAESPFVNSSGVPCNAR